MELQNVLLAGFKDRLNNLPASRQAAIAEALDHDSLVVLSFDPGSGTTIGTVTGEAKDELWHLELTETEAGAIGEALVEFLNTQDSDFRAAVATILETGGRLMVSMTVSRSAPDLKLLLAVDGRVYPLALIDNVRTFH